MKTVDKAVNIEKDFCPQKSQMTAENKGNLPLMFLGNIYLFIYFIFKVFKTMTIIIF